VTTNGVRYPLVYCYPTLLLILPYVNWFAGWLYTTRLVLLTDPVDAFAPRLPHLLVYVYVTPVVVGCCYCCCNADPVVTFPTLVAVDVRYGCPDGCDLLLVVV